ncbi:MAG TPA: amino acid permease [Vicinamibacteria bacterium]|nr:amino acid permease [Vicinamibacteria bacterium]
MLEDTRSQSEPDDPSSPRLARLLGLKELLAIHIGVIIGSGIFIVPATIAGRVGSTGPMLLVWIVAGMLTLFGTLSLAELSSVLPQAGGPYVYLRESYGRVWGFLFAWNDFFINKAGSLAAIAVGFATFLAYFFPALAPDNVWWKDELRVGELSLHLAFGWNRVVAVAAIVIVTSVNVRGVKLGGAVMKVFTFAKVLALVGLVIAVFSSDHASWGNLRPFWPDSWNRELTAAFGLALISALWAYDGWIDVTLVAGEAKNPSRNVPVALLTGTLVVMAIYLATNVAFTMAIPLVDMSASTRIAADVAARVMGPMGAALVVIGILCSTFGAVNGMTLAGPRSIWAAGRDRVFAPALGRVHPKYRSPHVAIVTIGVWGSLLALSGSYDQLTAYVVFGSWFFYALTALGVLVMRRKLPEAPRPYRAWGYPWATLVFVVVAAWFLFNTLVENPTDAAVGIGLLVAGLPFYALWTRGR